MNKILLIILSVTLFSCASYPTKQEQLEMNKDIIKQAKVWKKKLKKESLQRLKYIASQKYYYDKNNNKYTVHKIKYNNEISWFMPVDKKEQFLTLTSERIYTSGDIIFKNVRTQDKVALRFNFYYDFVCGDRACYNTFKRESRTAITSEWVKDITRFEYRMYKVSRLFDDAYPQSTLLKFLYTNNLQFNSALKGHLAQDMSYRDVWFAWGRPYKIYKRYKYKGKTVKAYKYRLRDSVKKEWVLFENKKVKDFKYTFEKMYQLRGPYKDVYNGF